MIETWNQLAGFFESSFRDDLLFHVVPVHDGIHSAVNFPSVLFIYNLVKKKIFYYGFDHPDCKKIDGVEHKEVIDWFSKLSGTKWAIDKKSLSHMVPIKGTYDIGFMEYLISNKVIDFSEFETIAHKLIRRNFPGKSNFGKFVPLIKHLETFSELAEIYDKTIKRASVDGAFCQFNEQVIESLGEIEQNGLEINPSIFKEHFGDIIGNSTRVYTQYNVYTSTGRPSNRFGGINYAALNKEDGSRKAFVSRFGKNGKLVLIDYSAFHPRIIAFLTKYELPKSIDVYEYLAKLYFNKPSVDESDISDAKQITFRQLFGGVQEEYRHIKYLSHLKDFIDYHWRFFNKHGYVETPLFKRKITNKHIQSPKPATVFNYILQATEGEISIPVLGKVNEILRGKSTKAVLYTYDSILFDYCFDDGDVLKQIVDVMGLDGRFPMKIYFGDNYHNMDLIS